MGLGDRLEVMVEQVLEVCSSETRSDIRHDLRKTHSVQATLNRIWDGEVDTLIVLESDEEDSVASVKDIITTTVNSRSNTTPPTSRTPPPTHVHDWEADNDCLPSPMELMLHMFNSKKPSLARPIIEMNTTDKPHSTYTVSPLLEDEWVEQEQAREKPESSKAASQRSHSLSSLPNYLREWEAWDDVMAESSTAASRVLSRDTTNEKRKREREEREREERERSKQQRQEAKKREKASLKEAEKKRRQRHEQVNRLKKSREQVLSEMTVYMDSDFGASCVGQLLQTTLASHQVEFHIVSEPEPYTLSWKRKQQAEWNSDSQQFIPFEQEETRMKEEPFVLAFVSMERLCELIKEKTLDTFVDVLQTHAKEKQILLMIEELEPYYKKRMLTLGRQFQATVLENMQSQGRGAPRQRKKTKKPTLLMLAEDGPDKEDIEEQLTYLQMMRDVMIVPTLNAADSVEWIIRLTADMAYAFHTSHETHRHQGSRCGVDPQDTWSKMLQEIQLCTPTVAESILQAFPTPQSLFRSYKEAETEEEARHLLANIGEVSSAMPRRSINKTLSSKIYTIFMMQDPDATVA
ncbi:hypothetical protein BDF14DRAFT_1880813 [Spinellus fusiger]|nr:hypothetical protein BDF14DRAFT_1880813 [Spinellus fusiger]